MRVASCCFTMLCILPAPQSIQRRSRGSGRCKCLFYNGLWRLSGRRGNPSLQVFISKRLMSRTRPRPSQERSGEVQKWCRAPFPGAARGVLRTRGARHLLEPRDTWGKFPACPVAKQPRCLTQFHCRRIIRGSPPGNVCQVVKEQKRTNVHR